MGLPRLPSMQKHDRREKGTTPSLGGWRGSSLLQLVQPKPYTCDSPTRALHGLGCSLTGLTSGLVMDSHSTTVEVFKTQLEKALSNLVWAQGWLCFEHGLGLEPSWGPCKPELSSDPKASDKPVSHYFPQLETMVVAAGRASVHFLGGTVESPYSPGCALAFQRFGLWLNLGVPKEQDRWKYQRC